MERSNNFKTNLPTRLSDILEKANINTPEAVLLKSNLELRNASFLTQKDVEIIKRAAALALVGPHSFLSAAEAMVGLDHRWRRLSVGCPSLDSFLGGGFAVRGITEVSGESGAGKTQLCLQAALVVQYPEESGGFNSGAVFICTEDSFPSRRLQQLFKTFPPAFQARHKSKKKPEGDLIKYFGDNIVIEHISDVESLVTCVTKQLPRLLASQKMGLVVIDSVGAVFRTEPVSPKRSAQMRSVGLTLHQIATEYSLAVVCINQVSSVMDSVTDSVVPCLGLSWANLVTTRIQLSRTNRTVGLNDECDDGTGTIIRKMKVIFAPDLPQSNREFVVTSSGVFGI